LNRTSHCIRVMAMLAAAITVAGCADSRMAASNTAQAAPPTGYKTGYGLSSDGPTTDLYTELFRSNKRDDKSGPANDNSAPATVPGTVVAGPVPQNQPAAPVSNAVQHVQPAPAAGVTRQEAAAQSEAPPATATVYGLSSDGTTTDLYTELFGPRRRE
jgi:hypothetical protein